LLAAATDSEVPLLPGAITPGEIMAAREAGLRFLKFFPPEQSGAIAPPKRSASPLADVKFCPTGGITGKNAADYLSLPNAVCVGGSWEGPGDPVSAGERDGMQAV